MGWLYQNEPLRNKTPAEYFTEEYTHDSEEVKNVVVATATVGNTVYAAIHHTVKARQVSFVYCAVLLFRNTVKDGFGYKAMTECMGPYEAECPERIMRLLSPVADIPDPGWTGAWRARVARTREERNAAKERLASLRPGDIIKVASPLAFPPTTLVDDRFMLIGRRKRTAIYAPVSQPDFRCRLRDSDLAGAKIYREPV